MKLKEYNTNVVGERILNIRLQSNLTQKEFGKMIGGVERSQISKMERGLNNTNKKRLERIADIGNITVGELLGNKTIEEEINEIKNNFNEEEIKEIIRKLI